MDGSTSGLSWSGGLGEGGERSLGILSGLGSGRSGRDWSGREGIGSGSASSGGSGATDSRSILVGDANFTLSTNVLTELSLEGSGLRVEDQFAGEVGSDRLGCSFLFAILLLELDGGAIESLDFLVKVERCRSGCGTRANRSGAGRGGGGTQSGLVVSNLEKIVQGPASGSSLGSAVSDSGIADSGPLGSGDGRLLCPDPLSGSGSLWDLIFGQLNSSCGPESFTGVDGVVDGLQFVFVIFSTFLSDLTGQSTDIGEFPSFAIRIDVSIFASGDAVHASGLFSEGAVFGHVAEGEGAVFVFVGVPFGEKDRKVKFLVSIYVKENGKLY